MTTRTTVSFSRRRGVVLVTMALTASAVLGVAGLAVDIGRMFVVKNETQVFCDAAAIAAAQALDGTRAGITAAGAAVAASTNKWNFGTSAVSHPAVSFATSASGTFVANPNPAAGYSYVQVVSSVSVPLYFLALVAGQTSATVTSSAVAGQIPITTLGRGVAPYTAISTNSTGPNFGFVAGGSYTIHWPTFNGNRKGCQGSDPTKCFNSPPCADDPSSSLSAVVANWGSQYHGYWGSNSNNVIASEVLDAIQTAPLTIGQNIDSLLTSGNKQSEASVLDERASQDTNNSDNTPATYLTNSHNGRRLLPVAIVDPVDPEHTTVVGFGQFLLLTNGSPSDYYKKNTNGNSPYCALYAGPYNIGSGGAGVGGSSGASTARLVQ